MAGTNLAVHRSVLARTVYAAACGACFAGGAGINDLSALTALTFECSPGAARCPEYAWGDDEVAASTLAAVAAKGGKFLITEAPTFAGPGGNGVSPCVVGGVGGNIMGDATQVNPLDLASGMAIRPWPLPPGRYALCYCDGPDPEDCTIQSGMMAAASGQGLRDAGAITVIGSVRSVAVLDLSSSRSDVVSGSSSVDYSSVVPLEVEIGQATPGLRCCSKDAIGDNAGLSVCSEVHARDAGQLLPAPSAYFMLLVMPGLRAANASARVAIQCEATAEQGRCLEAGTPCAMPPRGLQVDLADAPSAWGLQWRRPVGSSVDLTTIHGGRSDVWLKVSVLNENARLCADDADSTAFPDLPCYGDECDLPSGMQARQPGSYSICVCEPVQELYGDLCAGWHRATDIFIYGPIAFTEPLLGTSRSNLKITIRGAGFSSENVLFTAPGVNAGSCGEVVRGGLVTLSANSTLHSKIDLTEATMSIDARLPAGRHSLCWSPPPGEGLPYFVGELRISEEEVHCQLSDWRVASACSTACGAGLQTWSREVVQKPTPGGRPCPQPDELQEERLCSASAACPQVASWASRPSRPSVYDISFTVDIAIKGGGADLVWGMEAFLLPHDLGSQAPAACGDNLVLGGAEVGSEVEAWQEELSVCGPGLEVAALQVAGCEGRGPSRSCSFSNATIGGGGLGDLSLQAAGGAEAVSSLQANWQAGRYILCVCWRLSNETGDRRNCGGFEPTLGAIDVGCSPSLTAMVAESGSLGAAFGAASVVLFCAGGLAVVAWKLWHRRRHKALVRLYGAEEHVGEDECSGESPSGMEPTGSWATETGRNPSKNGRTRQGQLVGREVVVGQRGGSPPSIDVGDDSSTSRCWDCFRRCRRGLPPQSPAFLGGRRRTWVARLGGEEVVVQERQRPAAQPKEDLSPENEEAGAKEDEVARRNKEDAARTSSKLESASGKESLDNPDSDSALAMPEAPQTSAADSDVEAGRSNSKEKLLLPPPPPARPTRAASKGSSAPSMPPPSCQSGEEAGGGVQEDGPAEEGPLQDLSTPARSESRSASKLVLPVANDWPATGHDRQSSKTSEGRVATTTEREAQEEEAAPVSREGSLTPSSEQQMQKTPSNGYPPLAATSPPGSPDRSPAQAAQPADVSRLLEELPDDVLPKPFGTVLRSTKPANAATQAALCSDETLDRPASRTSLPSPGFLHVDPFRPDGELAQDALASADSSGELQQRPGSRASQRGAGGAGSRPLHIDEFRPDGGVATRLLQSATSDEVGRERPPPPPPPRVPARASKDGASSREVSPPADAEPPAPPPPPPSVPAATDGLHGQEQVPPPAAESQAEEVREAARRPLRGRLPPLSGGQGGNLAPLPRLAPPGVVLMGAQQSDEDAMGLSLRRPSTSSSAPGAAAAEDPLRAPLRRSASQASVEAASEASQTAGEALMDGNTLMLWKGKRKTSMPLPTLPTPTVEVPSPAATKTGSSYDPLNRRKSRCDSRRSVLHQAGFDVGTQYNTNEARATAMLSTDSASSSQAAAAAAAAQKPSERPFSAPRRGR
eukprot:TRINITY_DN13214_c0_g1_i1.p1 TRINITY_DN13214_c0_g1~~TRINITY_DN13214_c0_g1_i1.p1  ORF type:complete len:1615 (+),score=320.38 TRINITY_DN13214_c0_g1_i1:207-4847(+)